MPPKITAKEFSALYMACGEMIDAVDAIRLRLAVGDVIPLAGHEALFFMDVKEGVIDTYDHLNEWMETLYPDDPELGPSENADDLLLEALDVILRASRSTRDEDVQQSMMVAVEEITASLSHLRSVRESIANELGAKVITGLFDGNG